ncbi:CYTH domain protein [uncultured archaeon]|nr:CYTH domain protein [uncultured archaeon]
MSHINIEIKAKSTNHVHIREILKSLNAEFKGIDHQIDTYFKTSQGRLKLRQGNIENSLIGYKRENQEGPKQSDVFLYNVDPKERTKLKEALASTLGILVEVDKKREIYFVDNVKFHLDNVEGLGTFVEIEAIDKDLTIGKENLLSQCKKYMELFDIKDSDLISVSYSDLLLEKALSKRK